jgi:hypothetical protein
VALPFPLLVPELVLPEVFEQIPLVVQPSLSGLSLQQMLPLPGQHHPAAQYEYPGWQLVPELVLPELVEQIPLVVQPSLSGLSLQQMLPLPGQHHPAAQ